MLKFEVKSFEGKARVGVLETAHGFVETPTFMAVGTRATVKAMTPEMIKETGTKIVLGNTYHLMLRPGQERIKRFGGLHKFMRWNGPILTDSGGFQVMSLSGLRKITEEGVVFASHIDGTRYLLSPEKSIEIQHDLDADISMAFDECVAFPAKYEDIRKSLQLSMRWAKRSKLAFKDREGYGLFGIVQGGMYKDLRLASVEELMHIGFDGYAIGGLAVGEPQSTMFEVLDYTAEKLDFNKPRYLMGVGRPSDLVGAVARGVDMFDCVMPSRSGRTGQAFTSHGVLNLHNACHRDDDSPLDSECKCPVCQKYTRGYLYHLIQCKEILGAMLLTQHNLSFYQALMAKIRLHIQNGTFGKFYTDFLDRYRNDKKM